EFTLRNLKRGKGFDLFGVVITQTPPVKLERQLQSIPHKLQIAVNGFRTHFQICRQHGGVRIGARLNRLMNSEHPLQGWTSAQRGSSGHTSAECGIRSAE